MSPAANVPDLVGWKAIASYLRVSVRTAQEWAEKGPFPWMAPLPVFDSIWGKAAFSAQLGAWAGSAFVPHLAGAAARRGAVKRPGLAKARAPEAEGPPASDPEPEAA